MSLFEELSGGAAARPVRFVVGEVADDADPEELARVRVEAAELPGPILSPWLRVRTPDGRPMDGRVSVPETGSLVLLAVWEDATHLDAVVLGAIHGGEPAVAGPVGARVGPIVAEIHGGARLQATADDLALELDATEGRARLDAASLGVGGEACRVRVAAGSVRLVVSGAVRLQGRTVSVAASGEVALEAEAAGLAAPKLDLEPG